MKPEQQRIAIAEACGWKSFPYCIINGKRTDIQTWLSPQELEIGFTPDDMPSGTFAGRGVPSYCSDLNAMHEAEKVLTDEQLTDYIIELGGLGMESEAHEWKIVACATASQRAEAFLKTLGLWVEQADEKCEGKDTAS